MLLCLNESPFLMENKPLPYAEIRRQLIEGRQSCLSLVQQYLKQIDAFNAEYNVFLEVYREISSSSEW